jgi:hypothetical protein
MGAMEQKRGLIIYDFDGVIADSEILANAELADVVTELGVPTTLEDSYRLYMGKRFADVLRAIEASVGKRLPDGFASSYQERTLERFRKELSTVVGAREHIMAFPNAAKCIASSSSPDRLAVCLDVLGLQSQQGNRLAVEYQPAHRRALSRVGNGANAGQPPRRIHPHGGPPQVAFAFRKARSVIDAMNKKWCAHTGRTRASCPEIVSFRAAPEASRL